MVFVLHFIQDVNGELGVGNIIAFHCKCIRKLLGIPPSFISRVPNAVVMEGAGLPFLTELLTRRQVGLYKKICQMPPTALVKPLVCCEMEFLKFGKDSDSAEGQDSSGQSQFIN